MNNQVSAWVVAVSVFAAVSMGACSGPEDTASTSGEPRTLMTGSMGGTYRAQSPDAKITEIEFSGNRYRAVPAGCDAIGEAPRTTSPRVQAPMIRAGSLNKGATSPFMN